VHEHLAAQTDGNPLPTLAHDTTGDPGIHLAALEQAITDAGKEVPTTPRP
jgi:hypothetical protein